MTKEEIQSSFPDTVDIFLPNVKSVKSNKEGVPHLSIVTSLATFDIKLDEVLELQVDGIALDPQKDIDEMNAHVSLVLPDMVETRELIAEMAAHQPQLGMRTYLQNQNDVDPDAFSDESLFLIIQRQLLNDWAATTTEPVKADLLWKKSSEGTGLSVDRPARSSLTREDFTRIHM